MGVTFDETEKRFVFDFEHDGAEDIGLSIQRTVDSVHKKIDLYHYDIVVMPKTGPRLISIWCATSTDSINLGYIA